MNKFCKKKQFQKIDTNSIKEVINYNHETGVLTWKVSGAGRFKRAGMEVGSRTKKGYLAVCLNGVMYQAHRIAYAIYTGEDIDGVQIDHINGNKSDNRIENLRKCSNSQNQMNRSSKKKDESKEKNVHWCNSKSRWVVKIRVAGKSIYIGSYSDVDDAACAARNARDKYHGEFSSRQSQYMDR